MKNGQVSTDTTSADSSDGVADDELDEADTEAAADDSDWTAVDGGVETTETVERGDARTRCV